MTILITAALTILAVLALQRLRASLRRQKFPHDVCEGCTIPPPACRQPRARTDEQIDRLALKIHAMHVRASGDRC